MAYVVGQVLFIVPKDKTSLVPVQVVEEIVKKTIQGSVTSYMVANRSQTNEEVFELSKLSGELFESAEQARKALTQRAVAAVNQVVDRAIEVARSRFPNAVVMQQHVEPPLIDADDEEVHVMLEDGTQVKAKVHLPESLK